MPRFVFPGHKYLGPGNSLNEGEPVDTDDLIAYYHDHDYANARTTSRTAFEHDIRQADRTAIRDFTSDALQNFNWHSAIGAAGLGLKYAAESIVGVQYPGMPREYSWAAKNKIRQNITNKRNREQQGGSDTQRRRTDDEMENLDRIDELADAAQDEPDAEQVVDDPMLADAPASGGRGGSGGAHGTNSSGTLMIFKLPQPKSTLRKFYQQGTYIFWGNEWYNSNATDGYHDRVTSYATLPVDLLPFYLSEADYNTLRPGSKVKSLSTYITPVGEQTSFDTGTTLSGMTTAYHYVEGGFGIGINRYIPCRSVHPNWAENSMKLTGYSLIDSGTINADLITREWGDDRDTNRFPVTQGIPRDMPWRLALCGSTRKFSYGYERLNQHIAKFPWPDAKGHTFEYHYKPKNGALSYMLTNSLERKAHVGIHGSVGLEHKFTTNNTNDGEYISESIPSHAVQPENKFNTVNDIPATQFFPYNQIIEKAGLINYMGHDMITHQQPNCVFGITPVRANTPTGEFTTVNACGIAHIAREIVIEEPSYSESARKEVIHPHTEQMYAWDADWNIQNTDFYAFVHQRNLWTTVQGTERYPIPAAARPERNSESRGTATLAEQIDKRVDTTIKELFTPEEDKSKDKNKVKQPAKKPANKNVS